MSNAVPPILFARLARAGPRWTLVSEVEQVKKVANAGLLVATYLLTESVVRRVWQVIAAAHCFVESVFCKNILEFDSNSRLRLIAFNPPMSTQRYRQESAFPAVDDFTY